LEVGLSGDGKPQARILQPSGYPDLDAASVKLVLANLHLKSADYDGKPVMTTVFLIVIWSLQPKVPQ
jgi:hypothetical protein